MLLMDNEQLKKINQMNEEQQKKLVIIHIYL